MEISERAGSGRCGAVQNETVRSQRRRRALGQRWFGARHDCGVKRRRATEPRPRQSRSPRHRRRPRALQRRVDG